MCAWCTRGRTVPSDSFKRTKSSIQISWIPRVFCPIPAFDMSSAFFNTPKTGKILGMKTWADVAFRFGWSCFVYCQVILRKELASKWVIRRFLSLDSSRPTVHLDFKLACTSNIHPNTCSNVGPANAYPPNFHFRFSFFFDKPTSLTTSVQTLCREQLPFCLCTHVMWLSDRQTLACPSASSHGVDTIFLAELLFKTTSYFVCLTLSKIDDSLPAFAY